MKTFLLYIFIFLSYVTVFSQNTYHCTVSDAIEYHGIEDVVISLPNNKKKVFDFTYPDKNRRVNIISD